MRKVQTNTADIPCPTMTALDCGQKPRDPLSIRVALAAGGLVLALLLIEIGVRVFEARAHSESWSHRPRFWYLPETAPENRDFFYPRAKAAGTFRIIVVGDSFTYNGKSQFDDAFPKRLERMLNLNNAQPKVEVLNWGVPGFSTRQEARFVRRGLRSYAPDLVILEITLNDPELRPYHATHPKRSNEEEPWLFRHWKTLELVVSRYRNLVANREFVKYYRDLFEQKESWNSFAGAIDDIARMSKERAVPVFAAIFPLYSHPFDDRYPFAKYHEKIRGKLEAQGLPYVDLLPFFRGIPPEYLQVKPGSDTHPNEIAQRIAADMIFQGLRQGGLLPKEVIPKNLHRHGRPLLALFPRDKNAPALQNSDTTADVAASDEPED